MDIFEEALSIKKENGNLSQPFLMRKFKITAEKATQLMKDIEQHLIDVEVNKRTSEAKLKKFELHITAEYD